MSRPTRRLLVPGSPARARRRAERGDDAGFSLVETVVSLSVFALLMTSVAVIFVGGVRSSADMQRRHVAATLAAQAIELARAVPSAPDVNLCPRLLQGRSQTAVNLQLGALPADVDLSTTDAAWMPSLCTGPAVIPLQGLASVAGAAALDPVPVNGANYTVRTVIGTCRMPRTGGTCGPSLSAPVDAVTLFRVVVSVSWTATGCASGCSYAAATLIDPSTDPLFNARTVTPGPPVGVAAIAGDSQAIVTWLPPTTALDVPVVRYTVSGTPSGGGSPTTCTAVAPSLTCTLTGLTNGLTYVVGVVAESAYGSSASSSTVLVTPYPASIMTTLRMRLWLDGADLLTMFQDAACTTPAATAAQPLACWKDKSGQLDHALQPSAGSMPTLATVGTRPVPSFNGSSGKLSLVLPATLPVATTPSTTFVVGRMTDPAPASSSWRTALSWGTSASYASRSYQKNYLSSGAVVDTIGHWTASAGSWPSNATAILSDAFTSTAYTAYLNGVTGNTIAGSYLTGTTTGYVGAQLDGSQLWQGQVPEIIVLTGAVTTAERRTLTEYLARKWATVITPQAPTGVAATGAASSASVSWTPPGWDGGGAISSYTIVATPPSGPVVTKTGCASSPCTITGLAAATTYSFTVAAVNSAGTGPASAPATATTLGGPGAPTALIATPGSTTIGVAWTAPASNGGSAITGYTVTANPAGGGSAVTCSSGTTSCTLTGLTDGLAYTATVVATTAIGTGPASAPITSIPYPAALIGGSSLRLWLDAADLDADGAVAGTAGEAGTVSGAVQTWKDRSGGARDVTAGTALERPSYTSRTINALPVVTSTGTQMLKGVAASDPYTMTGDRTIIVVTRPRSWTSGGSATGDGMYLSDRIWPAANIWGEYPLFGIKVCGSPAAWCLQHRTDGQSSGSATTVSGTAAPSTGRTDIVLAQRSGSTDTLSVSGTVTGSASVSGTLTQQAITVGRHVTLSTSQDVDLAEILYFNRALSAGEQSTLQVYLARKWSITLLPGAPTGVTATPGNAQLAVAWTAPAFDGGSAITGYTVTAVPADPAFPTRTCTAVTTGCTVTSLSNGQAYTVSVTASNAAATGTPSSPVTATPAAPYVLDGVTATPVVAYGLRRLRSGYTGYALQLRRSDFATTSIGFNGAGGLDTAAVTSFCGSWFSWCYVSRWYDQSGNGIDAVQSNTGRQPLFVSMGTMMTANGLPTIDFDGSDQLMTGSAGVTAGGSGMTGNVVGLADLFSGSGQFVGFAGSTASNDGDNTRSAALVQRSSSSSSLGSYRNGGTGATIAGTDGVLGSHTAIFDGTNNTVYSGASSSAAVASTGTFQSTGAVTIGSDKDQTDGLSGSISEVTVFATALGSGDRLALMSSQRTYFGAPTQVLPASRGGAVPVAGPVASVSASLSRGGVS